MIELDIYNTLKMRRETEESDWDQIARYINPRRKSPENQSGGFFDTKGFCLPAASACQRLASAQLTYITPSSQLWFKFTADKGDYISEGQGEVPEAVTSWLNTASEIANQKIISSNFYTAIHEVFLDRSSFGVGVMYVDIEAGELKFKHISCRSVCFAENADGLVDTIAREYKFTAHQAAQEFELEALGPNLVAAWNDEKKRYSQEFDFIQLVRPNTDKEALPGKKFISVNICLSDKKIVSKKGYFDFPFLVTRFLKMDGSLYGISPAHLSLKDIASYELMGSVLDISAEVAAIPRTLALAGQIGDIDFRAGGVTVISPEAAQLGYPREWGTQGRYDIIKDMHAEKREQIEKIFYCDLFDVISRVDRQMTATEVVARENEKVVSFSPTFSQFTADFTPFMRRIFALLYADRALGDPPEEMINVDADGKASSVNAPAVYYMGKIALLLERIGGESLMNGIQLIAQLAQIPGFEDAINAIKKSQTARKLLQSNGMPEDCMNSTEEMKAIEAEQKQASQDAAAMQMAIEGAKANKDNAQAQSIMASA